MAKMAVFAAVAAFALVMAVVPSGVQAQEAYCRTVIGDAEPLLYAPIWNYLDSNKGFPNPGYQFEGVAFLGIDPYSGNLTTWGELTATNRSNNNSPIYSNGADYLVQAHQLQCDSVPLRAGERVFLDIPGLPPTAAANPQCHLVKWYYKSGVDGKGIMPVAVIPENVGNIDLTAIQSIQIRELTNRFFVSCATLQQLDPTCDEATYNASPLRSTFLRSGPFGAPIPGTNAVQVITTVNVHTDASGSVVVHASLIDASALNSYSTSKTYFVQLNGYMCSAQANGIPGYAAFRFDKSKTPGCPSNEFLLEVITIDGAGSVRKVITPSADFDFARFASGLSATVADSDGNFIACSDLAYTAPAPIPVPIPPYTGGYSQPSAGPSSPPSGYTRRLLM